MTTPDYEEIFQERAAIMQYDGKMSREQAEMHAQQYVLKLRYQQKEHRHVPNDNGTNHQTSSK